MGKCWNVTGTEGGGVVGGQQNLDAQLEVQGGQLKYR